jgi:hypothetical protein
MGAENTKKDIRPNRRSKWLENPKSDELQAMYKKPNIVTTIKVRRLEWAGHVVRMSDIGP